jgi:hypothetical protein
MKPITAPGIYEVAAADYHRDPVQGGSLSSSGVKKLMPPSCPAIFKAWLDQGEEHQEYFDVGRAAHARVLGVGDPIRVIDAPDWKTKAARDERDAAYAAGETPLLAHQDEQIEAMAAKLREHKVASQLLDPAAGEPERTLVAQDPETGVWRRAMVDFLRHPVDGKRLVLVDYKTAKNADPASIGRAVADYAYNGQGAWYADLAKDLGLSSGKDPAFVLIVQMKEPPYLVVCAQIDPYDLARGRIRNRAALHTYRRCMETGEWPGWADDRIVPVEMPMWAQIQFDNAHAAGVYDPEEITA